MLTDALMNYLNEMKENPPPAVAKGSSVDGTMYALPKHLQNSRVNWSKAEHMKFKKQQEKFYNEHGWYNQPAEYAKIPEAKFQNDMWTYMSQFEPGGKPAGNEMYDQAVQEHSAGKEKKKGWFG